MSFYKKITFLTTIVAGCMAVNTAHALELTALDGDSLAVNVNQPIVATDAKDPIFHYDQDGNVNNYIWFDENNNKVGTGVGYITKSSDAGKKIRLCLEADCSNSIEVISESHQNN
ncbi:hypothetical protein [Photobacterium minamisatsumaniensis]|uniref:hypothetical protein n=1 Tax=Photobacterium minamisatsumaniensis TaxID=2910233 RepID=UPI003D0CBA99